MSNYFCNFLAHVLKTCIDELKKKTYGVILCPPERWLLRFDYPDLEEWQSRQWMGPEPIPVFARKVPAPRLRRKYSVT